MSDQNEVAVTTDDTQNAPWWVKTILNTNPLLVRAVLVSIAAIAAQILKTGIDFEKWVDLVINLFTAISAVLAAYWAKPKVTPLSSVLAYRTVEGKIVPGPAQPSTDEERSAAIDAISSEG